jgi:hypothetical protein
MATTHYTAKAKDSRTLELPEEAQALGLKPGDEVHVFLAYNGTAPTQTPTDEEQQERFRILAATLYAEADATERTPGTYSDPQKAQVAGMIAEKHRKMGMNV